MRGQDEGLDLPFGALVDGVEPRDLEVHRPVLPDVVRVGNDHTSGRERRRSLIRAGRGEKRDRGAVVDEHALLAVQALEGGVLVAPVAARVLALGVEHVVRALLVRTKCRPDGHVRRRAAEVLVPVAGADRSQVRPPLQRNLLLDERHGVHDGLFRRRLHVRGLALVWEERARTLDPDRPDADTRLPHRPLHLRVSAHVHGTGDDGGHRGSHRGDGRDGPAPLAHGVPDGEASRHTEPRTEPGTEGQDSADREHGAQLERHDPADDEQHLPPDRTHDGDDETGDAETDPHPRDASAGPRLCPPPRQRRGDVEPSNRPGGHEGGKQPEDDGEGHRPGDGPPRSTQAHQRGPGPALDPPHREDGAEADDRTGKRRDDPDDHAGGDDDASRVPPGTARSDEQGELSGLPPGADGESGTDEQHRLDERDGRDGKLRRR